MSFFSDVQSSSAKPLGTAASPFGGADPSIPLNNLSAVQSRMDTLQKFLSDSVNKNTLISKTHMEMVSSEIAAAIHQIILNGAALLASTQNPTTPLPKPADLQELTHGNLPVDPKVEVFEEGEEGGGEDYNLIEIDEVELLAEHIHFCEICGKGFKRDANLRMHMRAHGNQFKTPEALAKPERFGDAGAAGGGGERRRRFSCPYLGCNRNKNHKKFRPLKSVICVKNHFKRSHCPKMYACTRCNKKNFSVLADLKSHLKHCGESKWKCSCGTSFSRKDKFFGHMALFEGHMPAVAAEAEEEKGKEMVVMVEDEEEEGLDPKLKEMEMELEKGVGSDEFFDGLIDDGFDSIDNYCFQELLGSPNAVSSNGLGSGIEGFFDF